MEILFDTLGVIGSLFVLFGFYRTSIGRWTGRSLFYELDNCIGAALIVVYQIHFHAYITVVLNIIWVIVAFRGITSIAERRKHNRHSP